MHTQPPPDFRGLVWEPGNEQDVVLLFGMLLARDPFSTPLCIQSIGTPFPDCIAINPKDSAVPRTKINIEFEYRGRHFLPHRNEWMDLQRAHPSERWWLVCWHDNLTRNDRKTLVGLEIVPLKEIARTQGLVHNWFRRS